MKPSSKSWLKGRKRVGPDSSGMSEWAMAPWSVKRAEALCIAFGYEAAEAAVWKPRW